jgi:sulfate transport system ATP-binding protein
MTVRDNMSFGLRQQRVEAGAITRQIDAAAEMLDLGALLDRRPAELSGGQRQRVAVGRAVVRNPAVFLMDEPLSNLDAGLRIKTRTEIKRLQRELGVTSIFVTHDQEEALEVANRVVVMDKGRIEQIGTPGDVYDNPATAFVHGFIGESIVLPVEVSGGSVRLGGRPLNIAADGAASGASKLFVRRHDMQIGPAGTGSLEGAVRHVRSFGPIQRAEIALSGGEGKTVIEIDAPRDRELHAGEIIGLQPRRYRIFAAQD